MINKIWPMLYKLKVIGLKTVFKKRENANPTPFSNFFFFMGLFKPE